MFKGSFTIFLTTKTWDDKFLLFFLDFSIFVEKRRPLIKLVTAIRACYCG